MEKEVLSNFIETLDNPGRNKAEFEKESMIISDTRIFFDKNNFKPINNHIINADNYESDTNEPESKVRDKTIVFIDGGSSIIFQSPQSILFFIRLAGVHYKNNERIRIRQEEFFCISKAVYRDKKNEKKLFYEIKVFTDIFPEKFRRFELDSRHETLANGRENAEQVKIVNIIMRNTELLFGIEICKDLSENSILMFDGSFKNLKQTQDDLFNELGRVANPNKISAAALSKTSSVLTISGVNPMILLNGESPDGIWAYNYGIINNYENHIHCYSVRLNSHSDTSFMLESISPLSAEELELIASNSRDAVFPGYPYGLIDADQFARVSKIETENMKTRMMALSGKDWKKIKENTIVSEAHEILDRIRF